MPPKMTRKMAKQCKDVYRGYIPPDLPQNRPPNRIKPWWKVLGKPMLTIYPRPVIEEWSAEPEYPPLNDGSKAGLKRQIRLDWYESLKSLPTAEQKQYEIAHHIRHYTANINNWLPTGQSLPFVKYLTQTHVINHLPVGYDVQSASNDSRPAASGQDDRNEQDTQPSLTSSIRELVLEQIRLAKYDSNTKEGTFFVSSPVRVKNNRHFESARFIESLVNQLRKVMVCETNPQLLSYQVDLSPAIRSWWFHSGFEPPNNKVYFRSRKDGDGNVNQIFQMDGSAALNLRSENLFEPIVDISSSLVTDSSLVEKCDYKPRYYGSKYKFKWPVALPGFWYQETPHFDCPHTTFLSTDCLKLRNLNVSNLAKSLNDEEDCLNGQAVLTAFGWLNSLAMFHGFTPFQQIDYPLTCQVVTTDGQNWLFNVYQFNTSTFHRDLGGPKRNNLCWSSGIMKLYGDYSDGKFIDVNDDVINILVNFLSKQTSQEYTNAQNLRPYLSVDIRSEEEKKEMRVKLRDLLEQRYNRWESVQWSVPDFEHIFFRSKVTRHQIKHMKPAWHLPKPKMPSIFE